MKKVRVSVIGLLIVAAMTMAASKAEAAVLVPGATVLPEDQVFDGGTYLDSVFYTVSNSRYTATMAAAVFRNLAGTLDFYYQIQVTAGPDSLRRLSTAVWEGFATDAREITDGSAIQCDACTSGFFQDGFEDATTADRSPNGAVVGFNWEPALGDLPLDPGETSLVMLIRTDAILYQPGLFAVINGVTETRVAFMPLAVPEPASLALFGIGLMASAGVMRRRRRAKQ